MTPNMKRLLMPLTLILLMAVLAGAVTSVAAAPAENPAQAPLAQNCQFFPETGYQVCGTILNYWRNNGGLAVFGYPISEQYQGSAEGWTGQMQWFERDRLEDHSSEGLGVLAGRLGARYLELVGRPWSPGPGFSGCQSYIETGYQVCGRFLSYFNANGGVNRFGYPITEVMEEQLEDGNVYLVQYFERRRMEIHGNSVLLGLLGRAVYDMGG